MDVLLLFVLSGYFALVLALIVGMIAVEWILFERAGNPVGKCSSLSTTASSYTKLPLVKNPNGTGSFCWFLVMVSTCATPSQKPMDILPEWLSYRFSSQ